MALYYGLVGSIGLLLLVVHTVFLGVFLFFFIFLRFVLPAALAERWVNPAIVEVALFWVGGILFWMRSVNRIPIEIDSDVQLDMNQWYLLVANHQSWVDIFALFHVFHRKIPILKFFIKKELAWIPIAGQAWWALDFPFMQRHSRAYLEKHPEKADDDLKATQAACEKFSRQPTSVVNFLEGTRYTANKHKQQQSPFKHLLKPKAGGIAFALQSLGSKFSTLLDVTIDYAGPAPSFFDLASGKIEKIVIHVGQKSIPTQFATMDYRNNPDHKREFQGWLQHLWQEKDQKLDSLRGR